MPISLCPKRQHNPSMQVVEKHHLCPFALMLWRHKISKSKAEEDRGVICHRIYPAACNKTVSMEDSQPCPWLAAMLQGRSRCCCCIASPGEEGGLHSTQQPFALHQAILWESLHSDSRGGVADHMKSRAKARAMPWQRWFPCIQQCSLQLSPVNFLCILLRL